MVRSSTTQMRMARSRRSERLVTSTNCRIAPTHSAARNLFARLRSFGIQPLPAESHARSVVSTEYPTWNLPSKRPAPQRMNHQPSDHIRHRCKQHNIGHAIKIKRVNSIQHRHFQKHETRNAQPTASRRRTRDVNTSCVAGEPLKPLFQIISY
jgi:hypothetical protein